MVASKISYIIGKHGYTLNEWTDLSAISVIFFGQEASVYTNRADRRFRFNSETSCLETAFGYTDGNGIFTSHRGETANYTPDDIVEFDLINGFISSVERVANNTYVQKTIK